MFLPLPPAIWQHVPGREFVAQGYRLLDMNLPWLPLALAPDRAMRSLLGLLVVVPSFFLGSRLDHQGRRRLLAAVVVVSALSAGMGLAQLSTGPESGLRFYRPTNVDSPVGFFANTNHFAVFLAASLPMAAAWIATQDPVKRPKRNSLLGFALYTALIAFVLILGRSLAGVGFLVLALIGSAHILWGRFASGRATLLYLAGVAAALLVAGGSLTAIGTGTIGAKFEEAPTSRANLTPVTVAAAETMLPIGSGLGSFAQIYGMHQPDRYTSATWVNHAHNDYAELYLELGLPGLLLVAAFLLWFARCGYRIWIRRHQTEMLIPQAAWMASAFLLMHSLVDYPLRTAALAALFAAFAGLATKPAEVVIKRRNRN
jgi:O-antigen ligase